MKGRITKTGYRRNSPDVNNDFNIIPSNRISMQGVDFPVFGVDNMGNSQMMYPGGEYEFQGDYVTELPAYGSGGLTQWFAEKWVDIKTGKKCGRSGKDKKGRPYPACRPSRRVNSTTPKTSSEMSASEKAKFKRKKKSGKRIDYNHKRAQLGGGLDPEMLYKGRYNTELTESEKKEFDKWVAKESKRQGRDILMDMGAYDVQGFWKSGDHKRMDQDNHGTDTWKKPNHPTFSNQSKYHGADGFYGGNWKEDGAYQPSKQTLEMYGSDYYDWMFGLEPNRPEHLDTSRYKSGANKPTPFYYQGGGDVFQEVDTYIKPGQNIRPNWAQTPDAVTNYTFGKNLVDDESRFSLGLQGVDILDEIQYRADALGSVGVGVGNRNGKAFRPAGENLRAGVRGQASWQGVPGNVIENMFGRRSGLDWRGSVEGEAGLAYANGAVRPYLSFMPQTNIGIGGNMSIGIGAEMRGRYDNKGFLTQKDAYSGMSRGSGRYSLKYDMGDGDFIEGYYAPSDPFFQGETLGVRNVFALESKQPRFGIRLRKSFAKGGSLDTYQTKGEVPFAGMLDQVDVTFDRNTGENILNNYPYYNQLSATDRKYFNDSSAIGRGIRRRARVGNKSLYSEFESGAKNILNNVAELSGLAGSARFSEDPIGNLQGAGRAVEKFMMGTNPMARSFVNTEITPEESQQVLNTIDIASMIPGSNMVARPVVSKGAVALEKGIAYSADFGKLSKVPVRLHKMPISGNSNFKISYGIPFKNAKATKEGTTVAYGVGQSANQNLILRKYLDAADQEYYAFTNSFIANPVEAGRAFKMMDDLIPPGSVLKQPPGGSLSENSLDLMIRRLKDPRVQDVTDYGADYIHLNEYAKGHDPLGNYRMTFSGTKLNELNSKYTDMFDKLNISEFRGLGTRPVEALKQGNIMGINLPLTDPRSLEKYYEVSVPNIALKKLYQTGGQQGPPYMTEAPVQELVYPGRQEGPQDVLTENISRTGKLGKATKQTVPVAKSYSPRGQELLDASKQVSEGQGGRALEVLLNVTAAMENSLGEDDRAYGRNYTRSQMSIDDNAYSDIYDMRGEYDYTSSQKKGFAWLESLGLEPAKMDSLLRADNPLAAMATARLVYGRAPEALPNPDDPKALYNYYMSNYNKSGALKHGNDAKHYQRFLGFYNDLYGKKEQGGEQLSDYSKYDTQDRAWFAARKELGKGKMFMYGGQKYSTSTPKGL